MKNKKIYILAICLAVVLTGCSLGLVKKQNTTAVSNTATSSEEIATTTTDVSNWQSYTDSIIGIKIKFPKDWQVETNGELGNFNLSNVTSTILLNPYFKNTDIVKNAYTVRVSLDAFENNLTIDDWLNQYFSTRVSERNYVSEKKMIIAGSPAVLIERNFTDEQGVQHEFPDYFIFKDGRVIEISVENNSSHNYVYQNIIGNLGLLEVSVPGGIYKISNNNIFVKTIITQQIYEGVYAYYEDVGGMVLVSPQGGQQYLLSHNITKQLGFITGVIIDEQNSDIIFISTASTDNSCTNKIYSYNLKTGDLVKFYSESAKNFNLPNSSSCLALSASGMQGSKLILLHQDSNWTGGRCTHIWSEDQNNFLYIDLAEIKKGLKKFVVPAYKVKEESQLESQCLKSIN
jgi:PBP1b-binding outer membrane lipoprotein LpoB